MEIKYFVRHSHGVHLNHAYNMPNTFWKVPKCKNYDQYPDVVNKTE